MNLNRITDLYEIIKNRLPKTYPRPKLAFFEDELCMLENTKMKKEKDIANVYAVANPNTTTINLPMKMDVQYTNKAGQEITKTVPIIKQEEVEILDTLLHEICHFYLGEKYGYDSKQYFDEDRCNAFAKRWAKIFLNEKLI